MSGAELLLSVLGVVIPVLQAAITAKDRSAKLEQPRVHARTVAELHGDIGREQFLAIYLNLEKYRAVVEPYVDENDRIFASTVQKRIYRTVEKIQETAQELYKASENNQRKPEDLTAMEYRLETYARRLNNDQQHLMHRLSLQMFQRLGPQGGVVFLQPPTEQSEISGITSRSDIQPVQVSYDSDPELKGLIMRRDAALFDGLFDREDDVTEPTSRQSLALLLACRKRLPEIVKICLDKFADPTVTGDDGLGAIHNAIGTADVVQESSETIEILAMLIDKGVDPSACDCTRERLRPLHRAAMTKNVGAMRFLLEKYPDKVNLVDAEGKTALYHACATPDQKKPLIEEMVHRGANFAGESRPPMPDREGKKLARYLDEKNLR
ncbi:hypothetical protein G7Y79_00018g045000 [Physcia stellaris]|nr:hypothetical protein G7Y79_00018g045000 [Physcia stellaris]